MPTLQDILSQLEQQAGPRGYTFAGRAEQPGSGRTLQDILATLPVGELESGGIAQQSPQLLKALAVGGMTKLRLPPSFTWGQLVKKLQPPPAIGSPLRPLQGLPAVQSTGATEGKLSNLGDYGRFKTGQLWADYADAQASLSNIGKTLPNAQQRFASPKYQQAIAKLDFLAEQLQKTPGSSGFQPSYSLQDILETLKLMQAK